MKYLTGKTWIDWVKVIVAIDIAAVGIGLIFQQKIHILAGLLGSVSHIIFGILYIIVAVLIFKTVFPKLFNDLRETVTKAEDTLNQEEMDIVTEDTNTEPEETVGEMIDKTADKINTFVQGKAQEAKEEIQNDLNDSSTEETRELSSDN